MPICPKCHGAWLTQTDIPTRFVCLTCKTEFDLKPIEAKPEKKK